MLASKHKNSHQSLAKSTLAHILLISSMITLVIVCAQIYSDYHADLSVIDERLNNIERSYLTPIAKQAWDYNFEALSVTIDGIGQLPDVAFVSFVNIENKAFIANKLEDVKYPRERIYPINYMAGDRPVSVGQLTVVVELANVYERLIDKSILIAFSQAIKTFLVSVFILYFIYRLIVSRINKAKDFADAFSLDNLDTDEEPEFDSNDIKSNDELSQLLRAMEKMKKQLKEEIMKREGDQQKLFEQANYDSLTKLVNRKCAFDRLELLLIHAKRYDQSLAVIYLDIDHFKDINDSLGHDAGDELLKVSAERLCNTVRKGDIACRLGGDEFLLILTNLHSPNAVEIVIEKLENSFSQEMHILKHSLYVTLSIGISIFPSDGKTMNELIKNADTALYSAKKAGRNCHRYFEPQMNKWAEKRLEISSRLRKAISENEFTIYCQPLLNIKTGKVVGAEALIRWFNKEEGVTPPDNFIPISEENGLIVAIGDQVAELVLATAVKWEMTWGSSFRMAINISARELREANFVDRISRQIKKYNIRKSSIEIEVTERLLLDKSDKSVENLLKLSLLGLRLSLDDFGTGYSSLSYLQKYPFSTLKLDRSFLKKVPHDRKGAALSSAIIHLAHSLGFEVIAEGVETEAQYRFLEQEGCDIVQGFYIAKPMSVQDFERWMEQCCGSVDFDTPPPAKQINV
ncbi:EAL domain-containing protein [Endozoicomonas sp. SM1973]|uniref:EAL domain-containing protein n=1 Tax=Spartinivicinus marinus TaxID=2994442 RepID=A0A853HXK3_9GAMM|nr:EAL domain-containing protein [Spartinivicinus marinus]MCX4029515.1 EAL domain-containing protein [Spartinivicinus marinus]NYZ65089.1 EAL domain-containing protein [Spartinivicinus marinus]